MAGVTKDIGSGGRCCVGEGEGRWGGDMSAKDEFGLLPKQRTFADFYLGGMFATEALRAAGYGDADAGKAAHRMLNRKAVQGYLRAERERLAEKAGVKREDVVDYLCRVILTPIARADEEARELLVSDRSRTLPDGQKVRRVRMVNKMAAVKQLCAMMGWNKPEKQKVTVFGVSQDELGEMIRKARAGGAKVPSDQ